MQLVFSPQIFDTFTTHGEPPEDLCCNITRRLVVRPVNNPEWPQHVFEQKPLHRWLGTHPSHPTDPVSRTPLAPEQVQYDARRGIAAKLFRRQLAAHHWQRANAPDITQETAQEARLLAATFTAQRFCLERAALVNSSDFNGLLAKLDAAILCEDVDINNRRAALIDRLCDLALTSQELSVLSAALSTSLENRENMENIRMTMTLLPAASRAIFCARTFFASLGIRMDTLLDDTSDTDSNSSVFEEEGIEDMQILQVEPSLLSHMVAQLPGPSAASASTAQYDGPQLGDLPTLFREPPSEMANLDDEADASIGLAGTVMDV